MVALRLIPCLDVANGRVVKGVNFVNLRDSGDPVELACRYSDEGADELVFLDIRASVENRNTLVDLVSRTAKSVKIPFTVGGGIDSVSSINDLLRAGADKVSLNSSAVRNPDLISKSSREFGSQCIVIAIDARKKVNKVDEWEVYVKGGRENTGIDVISWAKKVEELGAGEILLTSMDGDGTQNGYDLHLTESVASIVKIPVIASGGAGSLEDIYDVFSEGKASAALLASLLHDKKLSLQEIKTFLLEKNFQLDHVYKNFNLFQRESTLKFKNEIHKNYRSQKYI